MVSYNFGFYSRALAKDVYHGPGPVRLDKKNGHDAGDDWKKGKPVRVVRGAKHAKHSKYAPEEGNRYDGIYKVKSTTCMSYLVETNRVQYN